MTTHYGRTRAEYKPEQFPVLGVLREKLRADNAFVTCAMIYESIVVAWGHYFAENYVFDLREHVNTAY